MKCVICSSEHVEERSGLRVVDVGSYELTIDDRYMHCTACEEEYHTGEQAKAFDERVVEERRHHEGLLSGSEIRRIRNAVGLSQAELEAAVGIGSKTIVRWEKNLGVQSKTIDDVLRLIEFDPDNLRLLVRIRQAARASILEAKIGPEDHVKQGELQAAIVDGLERANVNVLNDMIRISETIFSAIQDYKNNRIIRLAEESRISA